LVAGLFGVALFIGWQDLHARETFAWETIRHWLAPGLISLLVFTLMITLLTVVIYAFNADWHTFEGFVALLVCLVTEVLVIAVLAGLGLLIAAGWQMAR
jgi:hypothetical protein